MKGRSMGLTTAIFAGLVLGILTGILLHYLVPAGWLRDQLLIEGIFYVVGNGFLRLMQMLVVPLVFSSLVCGSMAMGDTKKLGKIGMKAVLFYLFTTAIAITVAILVSNVINPGLGLNLATGDEHQAEVTEPVSLADTLLHIIPANPVQSLANADMLPIILFALFTGVMLAGLGERAKTAAALFEEFNEVMMQMTLAVMKLAPVGVFCLTAKTFSQIGFGAFLPLIKYMLGVFIALAIHCFVVYMLLLRGLAGLSPAMFLRKYLPVMGFAFSTASSTAAIPLSIETLEEKLGVSGRISSFTVPLGATVNMDGTAIMQGVAVVFAAQAFGIPLTPGSYLTVILTATMASIGTAGVPGVGLITLSMVFASVGLPAEAIALIMGIDRILDMSRTAVNVTGDAVCTVIIAVQENEVDRERYWRP